MTMGTFFIYTNLATLLTMILLSGIAYGLVVRRLWFLFFLFGALCVLLGTAMQTLAVYLAFDTWDYHLGAVICNRVDFLVACCAVVSCTADGIARSKMLTRRSYLFGLIVLSVFLLSVTCFFALTEEQLRLMLYSVQRDLIRVSMLEEALSLGFYAQLMAFAYFISLRRKEKSTIA